MRASLVSVAIVTSFFAGLVDNYRGWFHIENSPITLPAYYYPALQHGVTGTVTMTAVFEHGKAKDISVTGINLRSRNDQLSKDPAIREVLLDGLTSEIRKWHTNIVSQFRQDITVELRIDKNLKSSGRSYLLDYGKYDLPVRLVLIGPRVPSAP